MKKLLKKTATKNTAVSCHWIRSRRQSELKWVVGKRTSFNELGYCAVNTTKSKKLKSHEESNWHYLPLIKSITALAALFHDWGKSSFCFQQKLTPKMAGKKISDPVRHEWVSCLLLNSFINGAKNDSDWLERLAQGDINQKQILSKLSSMDIHNSLPELPILAEIVTWLIMSHHRLPFPTVELCRTWKGESAETFRIVLNRVTKGWGYSNEISDGTLKQCLTFPHGLPSQSSAWMKQAKKWSLRILQQLPMFETAIKNGFERVLLHHIRLALMLGDHSFSAQKKNNHWQVHSSLYANTDRKTRQYKQYLDEHLVGVARRALGIAHRFPQFEGKMPVVSSIKNLHRKSPKPYDWQDKAVAGILKWREANKWEKTSQFGFFAVNLASTGTGKTFANAKVMQALSSDSDSLRYVLALGLRTLTLQTGDEYRSRIFGSKNDKSEMAVIIGSKAVLELHQSNQVLIGEQTAWPIFVRRIQ